MKIPKHLSRQDWSRMTPEQQDIARAVERGESFFANALAGTGKTSTLRASLEGSWAMFAFNRKNADELLKANPDKGVFGRAIPGEVMTLNGLGHRAWARYTRSRPKPTTDKYWMTARDLADSFDLKRNEIWPAAKLAEEAVSAGFDFTGVPRGSYYPGLDNTVENWGKLADQYLDEEVEPHVIDAANEIAKVGLLKAFGSAPVITFNEQICLPLRYGAKFCGRDGQKFSRIAVDEAQDLSPMNQEMIRRALAKGGQLVAVGDPNQAIYGFRGADLDSVNTMKQSFDLGSYPLTINWRCDLAIIEHIRELVPEIQPRPNAGQGLVRHGVALLPEDGDWVLARTNARVIEAAFQLIRDRRSIQVLGSDIARGLKNLVLKVARKDESTDIETFTALLKQWFEVKEANKDAYPEQYRRAKDQKETLDVFLSELSPGQRVSDLLVSMEFLFKRKGRITCSTIHRSKGAEARGIWITQAANSEPWMQNNEQEQNLDYVSRSRAEEELNYVRLKEEEGD